MLFPSLVFLTIFLPVVCGLYFLAADQYRNSVLLVASIFFYTWGAGKYLAVLMVVAVLAYGSASILQRFGRGRTWPLVVAVAAVLAPLIYFKYVGFFSALVHDIAAVGGVSTPELPDRTLPIGISFFTFQALSYVFDVRRGSARAALSFRSFLLYVALFPQLVAGPIVRYSTVATELVKRSSEQQRVAQGVARFVHGLSKKVLIADSVSPIVDSVLPLTTQPHWRQAWGVRHTPSRSTSILVATRIWRSDLARCSDSHSPRTSSGPTRQSRSLISGADGTLP